MKLPVKNVTVVNHAEAGSKIRELRLKAKMSVRKLAKLMGFSPPFISDLERGRRNWTPDKFEQAIKILSK